MPLTFIFRMASCGNFNAPSLSVSNCNKSIFIQP
jgi:hypothetical protein